MVHVYHGRDVRTVPSQDDHPWNPQTRTTTETVRPKGGDAGAGARAGHMLARIVVEIRAADNIAVELEPQL